MTQGFWICLGLEVWSAQEHEGDGGDESLRLRQMKVCRLRAPVGSLKGQAPHPFAFYEMLAVVD
jgi:hypothetical protein